MSDVLDPAKYAIDSLIAAGRYSEAGKLAIRAAANGLGAALAQQAAPEAPSAAAGPAEGVDFKSHAELSGMTLAQVADYRATNPEGYRLSLDKLGEPTRSGRPYRA